MLGRRQSGRARAPCAARNAGPMIRKTAPNVLGVSSPSGIAVTSRPPGPPGQPERHRREDQVADHDADGRPRDHPRQHELGGHPERRRPAGSAIRIMSPTLSSISPKKALTSPRAAQA